MNNFQRATEYYNQKNYKNAIEMYNKSLQSADEKSVCLYNSAVCYIKMQKYNEAIPLLISAATLKRKSNYFFNLGYCYSMTKDYKKALINFNTAWSLDENDEDCERAINMILKHMKKR